MKLIIMLFLMDVLFASVYLGYVLADNDVISAVKPIVVYHPNVIVKQPIVQSVVKQKECQVEPKSNKLFSDVTDKLYARVTYYRAGVGGESKRNHKGDFIMGKTGMASPSRMFQDGTKIFIPSIQRLFVIDDRIPQKSVRKHFRVAERKGIDIDCALDLRGYNKDLGYQVVWVVK